MSGFRPTPGTEFQLDGKWYLVESYDPKRACLVLVDSDGVLTTISIDDLVHHPDLRVPDDKQAAIDLLATLAPTERDQVLRRVGHVQEVLTGFRSGDPNQALPGEPKPQYDPATTFKGDRYEAKRHELDNEFARRAGESMSVPTMRRLAKSIRDNTVLEKSVNGRHRRRSSGRRRVPSIVEEQIVRFVDSHREGSNMTYKGMWISVRAMVAQKCGDEWTDKEFPSYATFRRYLLDNWTPSQLIGKARSRASAVEAPEGGFHRSNPTRPGQLVLMDTNNLDVLLKGTILEDAIRGSLVVGLDVYSRGPCAVRVVEQAEKGLDVSFAFLDLARPKPMMSGWPEKAQWPFAGLPNTLIPVHGSYGGTEISGMPFVNPEALGLDHGTSYKNLALRSLLERYHVDILPARVRTGSDKAFIERFFGALRSMLLEHLSGYRGTDTSERGVNVDQEVEWTAQALEDLICKWVVLVWQTHIMDDIKPPWCPEGDWSPQALYAHGISTSGLAPRLMTSEDYYSALRTTHVKVQSRGVKVLGLWYDNDPDADEAVLDSRRNRPHPSGLKLWTVQYDRRDMRRVWFIDEHDQRHRLRWVGATGEFPCFSDRHINALRNRVGSRMHLVDDLTLVKVLINEVLASPVDIGNSGTNAGTSAAKQPTRASSSAARDQQLAQTDAAKYGVDLTGKVAGPDPAPATVDNRSALEEKRRTTRDTATPTPVEPAPTLGSRRTSMLGSDYEEDAS